MPHPSAPVAATTRPGPRRTRADLVGLADQMLAAVRPFASRGHARITLPGREGGYGRAVDGLEGFARTLLLAGFRVAGDPEAPEAAALLEWYARGIAAGSDPSAPDRWVRLDEHPQAKVEAASIALILDLTRPWLWDRLGAGVKARVVDYLAPAVGDDTYPRINWVWFRLVVQTFLRSVGGPYSLAEMAEDLATHDTFARAEGWMSDGPERSYDHYAGWALHLYPTLWSRMAGASDLAAARRDRDIAMLDRFLTDAVALIGADGSPLIQGRSLIYRFAAAAPFWVGALAGVPSHAPGLLRRAATSVIAHFADHGAPDARHLLTVGWHRPWPRLAQSYSGPSSPYWAGKGLLGIALAADHPVWTGPEEPLPVERSDVCLAVRSAGWLVSGTRADGIVRVVNHGTDHAVEGSTVSDSPLYARLGYSTATCPVLDETGWSAPVDQTVALVDRDGHPTHRAGMRTLPVEVRSADGIGVGGSVVHAHWVDAAMGQRDHGAGRSGAGSPAGVMTVCSVVRGPWELRLVRVESATGGPEAGRVGDGGGPEAGRVGDGGGPEAGRVGDGGGPEAGRVGDGGGPTLRVGGWPVAGDGADVLRPGSVRVSRPASDGVPALRSSITALRGPVGVVGGVTTRPDGGPLGGPVRVPWLDFGIRIGVWVPVLVELTGAPAETPSVAASVAIDDGGTELAGWVVWPDGVRTKLHIEEE